MTWKVALALVPLLYVFVEVWRALARLDRAKKLAQSAESRIRAGENAICVIAELVAVATAQNCDDVLDDIVESYGYDELPNLAEVWKQWER